MNWFPSAAALEACGAEQEMLHERAAATARHEFGKTVFVRAVVEVSNYCRENCHYCGMRRDNRQLDRYRAELEGLAELLTDGSKSCFTDLNIQAGEDPVVVREIVVPLVKALRHETRLGISVCLGTISPELTRALQEAGATTYIVKFELADPLLYERLEAPGTLQERIGFIRSLAADGWHVSSGFIAGLPGQGTGSLVQNLTLASQLPLVGCSVSPFVAGEETPLATAPAPSVDLTLNSMAALRLMRPAWVIPAVSALNLAGPADGYRRGLRTGANLCTINLTPTQVRGDYLLYKRDRHIMTELRVLEAIAAEGLEVSTVSLADHFAGRLRHP